MNNKGITFIEIIVTMAIAGIITGMAYSIFFQWKSSVLLINQVDEFKSKIIEVRQAAISAENEKNWGIHLEENAYIIFSGNSYNELAEENELIELKNALISNPENSLSDGIGGFSPDLIFTKFSGETANTGTVELIYKNNPEVKRFINIENGGKIN
ncbi:prepilin-type N-terminal cleavage/methylation domain-containing protein [Candidatus Nomurabacteria bacterium]|nr:prepilin-type N-terminal cleavage/methylation domain-containing protein [Candidatus Nomurabacteria bacterium]